LRLFFVLAILLSATPAAAEDTATGRLNTALALLPESSQVAARTVVIEVAPIPSLPGALGGFYPQERRIVLRPVLFEDGVDIAVLATMLLHELVHVQQYANRSPGERACYEDEIEAFRAQAIFWMDAYGPNGKQPATSRTEIGLNNLVMAHRRGILDQWVVPSYVEICR
jgi:hypothetical protein